MHSFPAAFLQSLRFLILIPLCCLLFTTVSCSEDGSGDAGTAILTGLSLSDAEYQKLRSQHRPLNAFDDLRPPPAPDYASPESWAALWPRADEADVASPNTAYPEAQNEAHIDAFFIHPTCYTKKDYWNGPIDDPEVRKTVSFIMMYLASAFNAASRVYAPRYRQFTLFSVAEKETHSGMQAIELAYSDVKAAFDYYITHYNSGRPFILASHSQGSMHGSRLLQTRIVGSLLQTRLVAAYLIGMAIPENLRGIAPASSEVDCGGYINWNAMTREADTRFFTEDIVIWVGHSYRKSKGISILQVNPLSWLKNGGKVEAVFNPGSLPSSQDVSLSPLLKGVTSADASGTVLIVEKPTVPGFPGDGPDAPLITLTKGIIITMITSFSMRAFEKMHLTE
jgi:hypothetical protein